MLTALFPTDSAAKSETERDVEKGKENGDDATVKAKRKRKKKHKEKLKIEEEVIPLRVLSKYDPNIPFSVITH